MQKVWRRIFLLCMACMICLQGLCLADDEKENWVEYYRETEQPWNIYYVDTNSIKALDYNGRKYLEANVRCKEETYEYIWVVVRQIEVTNAKWHKVFDIENQKVLNLEFDNKYANPKKGKYDISELGEKGWDLHKYLFEERLEKWIEQNYPAVINKIRTHNQSMPGAKPAKPVNTGATGAPNVPSGMTPTGFNITEDGWVGYTCRSMMFDGGYLNDKSPRFIFARPTVNEIPGGFPAAYMIAFICPEEGFNDAGVWYKESAGKWATESAFDYDAKNNTFTFYHLYTHDFEFRAQYICRIRVIDKNTVFYERIDGDVGYEQPVLGERGTLSYVSAPTNNSISYKYNDGYCWYGKVQVPPDGHTYFTDVTITDYVDAALAFLAAHGNVTEPPEDFLDNSTLSKWLGLE